MGVGIAEVAPVTSTSGHYSSLTTFPPTRSFVRPSRLTDHHQYSHSHITSCLNVCVSCSGFTLVELEVLEIWKVSPGGSEEVCPVVCLYVDVSRSVGKTPFMEKCLPHQGQKVPHVALLHTQQATITILCKETRAVLISTFSFTKAETKSCLLEGKKLTETVWHSGALCPGRLATLGASQRETIGRYTNFFV